MRVCLLLYLGGGGGGGGGWWWCKPDTHTPDVQSASPGQPHPLSPLCTLTATPTTPSSTGARTPSPAATSPLSPPPPPPPPPPGPTLRWSRYCFSRGCYKGAGSDAIYRRFRFDPGAAAAGMLPPTPRPPAPLAAGGGPALGGREGLAGGRPGGGDGREGLGVTAPRGGAGHEEEGDEEGEGEDDLQAVIGQMAELALLGAGDAGGQRCASQPRRLKRSSFCGGRRWRETDISVHCLPPPMWQPLRLSTCSSVAWGRLQWQLRPLTPPALPRRPPNTLQTGCTP